MSVYRQSHQKFYACSPSPCIAFFRHTTSVLLYYVIQLRKKKHSGIILGKTMEKGNITSIVSVLFLFLFSSWTVKTIVSLYQSFIQPNYKTIEHLVLFFNLRTLLSTYLHCQTLFAQSSHHTPNILHWQVSFSQPEPFDNSVSSRTVPYRTVQNTAASLSAHTTPHTVTLLPDLSSFSADLLWDSPAPLPHWESCQWVWNSGGQL